MNMTRYKWVSFGLIAGLSALAYLPLVGKIGYKNDDWYLMYDGLVGGAGFFHNVFSIDRPLRGYLIQTVFSLFGLNPLPYHLSAYGFRLLSGIGLLWLCSQLWPAERKWNLLAAVLFLIYPGFLSQINPVDYQSQIVSLACGMFSIALTVKSIQSKKFNGKWIYASLSILLAWIYLGLVEYFIGFEVLRLVCVVLLFMRNDGFGIVSRFRSAVHSYLPFILGAGGFLVWRLLLFSAERKATDVTFQLSALLTSPFTLLWWLNYLMQDVLKVIFFAWVSPLDLYVFSLRLRDFYLDLTIAVFAAVLFVLSYRWLEANEDQNAPATRNQVLRTQREKYWVAITTILAGLLPITMVNRHVVLPDYSRYTLAASVGVAVLWSVLLQNYSSRKLILFSAGLLVGISIAVHYGNSVYAAAETESMRDFWWQVAWRAPGIKPGVTLVAEYPVGSIQEDYFIWGPANLIYYPEKQNVVPINIQLPAAVLTGDVVSRILFNGGGDTQLRRGNFVSHSYGDVLILAQASDNSCVRILNGNAPDLSATDQERIKLVAPHSNINAIQTGVDAPIPPAIIFGSEPAHGWCYYYQKADLARQLGNWDEVARLGDEAENLNLHPNDQIEWMPFVQAYAALDNLKEVKIISTRMNTDFSYKYEACRNLTAMTTQGYEFSAEMQNQINDLFCQ